MARYSTAQAEEGIAKVTARYRQLRDEATNAKGRAYYDFCLEVHVPMMRWLIRATDTLDPKMAAKVFVDGLGALIGTTLRNIAQPGMEQAALEAILEGLAENVPKQVANIEPVMDIHQLDS